MKKLLRASEIVVFLLALLGTPRLAVAADSGSWIPTGSMSVSRSDHTVTLLTDGNVLIVGGFTFTAELYDPIAATFTPTGNTLFFHGQGATATRLLDGRVLIVGGNAAQQSAEIYDPTTATFGATGTPTAPHAFHTATLLPNGKVLIAAGQDLSRASHAVAELYDPTTGIFMPTGSLNDHRFGQAATLLPNGKVLIAGGIQFTPPGAGICLKSAETYDPATGTFVGIGDMNICHGSLWQAQAPLMNNGKVLITGGPFLAELFDPTTGTFSTTGSMTTPRRSHTATLLPNGPVLIAGGIPIFGPVTQTNSAELYNPVTETFAATASMVAARAQHTATVLSNGQVLVTGGFGGSGGFQLNSAELFSITLPVAIDIKPGTGPNAINPANAGLIPVAILTTDTFDATTVSPITAQFGPAGANLEHQLGHLEDVDSDGDLDLVLHFRTQESGIQCGDTEASLTGETFDGQAIQGSDSIVTVGCN